MARVMSAKRSLLAVERAMVTREIEILRDRLRNLKERRKHIDELQSKEENENGNANKNNRTHI